MQHLKYHISFIPTLYLMLMLLSAANHSRATTETGSSPSEQPEVTAEQHREAFLGKDAAPEFNNLTPDQAKERLKELLTKIDTNKDHSVSEAEMVNWMRSVAHRDRLRLAERRFDGLKEASESENLLAPLTFEEYERAIQSELTPQTVEGAQSSSNETGNATLSSLTALMERSRRRWAKADANSDGALTAVELADFLRPEESPRMRDVVVAEALGHADSNGDGRVDMGEYLKDLYPDYERDRREGNKKMPDWVAKEEMHFKANLDADKNGVLDGDELYKLAMPDSADHAKAETNYLFEEADANGDKFLSGEEILKNWGLFVGHGATNFGAFDHQEL